MHRMAGGIVALSVAAVITFAADASTKPHQLAIPTLMAVAVLAAVVWFFTRPNIHSKAKRRRFRLVEAELAVAQEEVARMAEALGREWPHLTPDGEKVERVSPGWRARTTEFIEAVLSPPSRAAFKGATGRDQLERLEDEARVLGEIANRLHASMMRADEVEIRQAVERRRSGSPFNYGCSE